MTTTDIVSQHMLHLRAGAPKEFEAFVSAFDAYATEVTVAVTGADQNAILNCQGRAQAFLHLLRMFRECHIPPQSRSTGPSAMK